MLIYRQIPVDASTVSLELGELLARLPEWRRRYSLSYHRAIDQYLCARSYLLLTEILAEHFNVKEKPDFGYHSCGKPFLAGYPDIHFNFSHCCGGILCAVDHAPVGVDIENIQFFDDLARDVLSDREYQDTISSGTPEVRFTEYWTMKESRLKLEGTGLTDNIRNVLTGDGDVSFRLFRDEERGLVSCIATKNVNN